MSSTVARLRYSSVGLAGLLLAVGCQNGSANMFGGGPTRVPPPPTGSYGSAAAYYGKAPAPAGIPVSNSGAPSTPSSASPPAVPSTVPTSSASPTNSPSSPTTPTGPNNYAVQPVAYQDEVAGPTSIAPPSNELRWGTK